MVHSLHSCVRTSGQMSNPRFPRPNRHSVVDAPLRQQARMSFDSGLACTSCHTGNWSRALRARLRVVAVASVNTNHVRILALRVHNTHGAEAFVFAGTPTGIVVFRVTTPARIPGLLLSASLELCAHIASRCAFGFAPLAIISRYRSACDDQHHSAFRWVKQRGPEG